MDDIKLTQTQPRAPGWRSWLLAVLAGAALAWLFDPERGRGRRAQAADRLGGLVRRTQRRADRLGRRAEATVVALRARADHLGPRGQLDPDDATLTQRVRTELFRDPEIPKGKLNINAEHGVIVVRGAMDEAGTIELIERRILRIPGVVDVRNLLHLTGTPAPAAPAGPFAEVGAEPVGRS
jgi:hypothetical protein